LLGVGELVMLVVARQLGPVQSVMST